MILNICYNDNCAIFPEMVIAFCQKHYPKITINSYNESNFKEKTKAYKLKGGYSARMTPFVLITNENKEYLKAFYSEDNGCTIESVENFLNQTNNI